MEEFGLASGGKLDLRSAGKSLCLICSQCPRDIVRRVGKFAGQNVGVLHCHRRALAEEGQHRMSRVTEKRDALHTPRRERLAIEKPPFEALASAREQNA